MHATVYSFSLAPFQYVAWEMSTFDLDEEEEDTAALQREEEDTDNDTEKEDDEVCVLIHIFYLKLYILQFKMIVLCFLDIHFLINLKNTFVQTMIPGGINN